MKTEHTKTPWHLAHFGEQSDGRPAFLSFKAGPVTLARFGSAEAPCTRIDEANAAYALRAVNSHAALIAALENFLDSVDVGGESSRAFESEISQARAALALAKGEA